MTRRLLSALTALDLAAVALGGAGRADAQCRLCAVPSTTSETDTAPPIKLEVETNLDFDRLILGGPGIGSAMLEPDGSSRTAGNVVSIGGRAMAGSVTVRGEPGRALRIGLPQSISLFGLTGGEVRIDAVRSDLPAAPRIGANGTLTFRFGGELHVSGDVDGAFRGDFSIDVEYL